MLSVRSIAVRQILIICQHQRLVGQGGGPAHLASCTPSGVIRHTKMHHREPNTC
jgi:hypothetical protein